MAVLLVRHAEAVSEGRGLSDEQRYLTRAGRAAARALGGVLIAAGVHGGGQSVDRILTSPLVRAVQTAELLAAALDLDLEIEATAVLAPGVPLARVAALLDGAGELVVAVGHEPGISALAAALLGDRSGGGMRTAEACLISDLGESPLATRSRGPLRDRWGGDDDRRGRRFHSSSRA